MAHFFLFFPPLFFSFFLDADEDVSQLSQRRLRGTQRFALVRETNETLRCDGSHANAPSRSRVISTYEFRITDGIARG